MDPESLVRGEMHLEEVMQKKKTGIQPQGGASWTEQCLHERIPLPSVPRSVSGRVHEIQCDKRILEAFDAPANDAMNRGGLLGMGCTYIVALRNH